MQRENGHTKSTHSEGSGNDSPEMSRVIRLQDTRTKHIYSMLTASVKERTLWLKFLDQARNEYLENEKCFLQRQQSSEYKTKYLLCNTVSCLHSNIPCISTHGLSLKVIIRGQLLPMNNEVS